MSRDVGCSQGITYQRYLYLKKHETDSAKNTGLFVVGIPFFHQDTTAILRELFEGFGPVKDVALHPSKVRPGSVPVAKLDMSCITAFKVVCEFGLETSSTSQCRQ